MAGLKFTLVRAAIALLIVERVVSARHASLKHRDGVIDKCGTDSPYNNLPCCSDDASSPSTGAQVGHCSCRCIAGKTGAGESGEFPLYCEEGYGVTAFTLVSDLDEEGDSAVGGGTGATGHISRPNMIISYIMWIGIVFTLIYAIQIAQRH